ncbi:MAG: hypothetical protein UC390_07400, partial [Peptococcaceae bacterium]|nr:hypothetical protein [Peptococcaceae bacterium]
MDDHDFFHLCAYVNSMNFRQTKKQAGGCVVPPIIWTSELLGVFLLSKLTHQQKLEIYAKRKAGYTISHLSL